MFLAIDMEQEGSCLMEHMEHELRQFRRKDRIYEGPRLTLLILAQDATCKVSG